jgi:prophage regulatory protein
VETSASLLPETGYLRLKAVLAVYPVSRSTWYRGVAEGRFPKPVALSARTVGYPVEGIKKLIEAGAGQRRVADPRVPPSETPSHVWPPSSRGHCA